MTALRERHAEAVVATALRESRVVIINGPRQAGKTTLSRLVQRSRGGAWVSLDSPEVLHACVADPPGFLAAYPRPLFIDEFQRAGDALVRAIKVEVDRDSSRGQFLLSGSSRFLTIATISESLAGRVQIVDLWPFTQGEAEQLGPQADTLLSRLFDDTARLAVQLPEAPLDRASYLDRICRGGYPEVHALPAPARRHWFDGYLRTVMQRDAPAVARGRHLAELPRLARVLGARTGQELIVDHIARESGIERTVLARTYLPLLETLYLTLSLPAWSRNFTTRAVRHPKTYIGDPGLAARILGVSAEALGRPGSPALGALLETFVVTELVRQAARRGEPGISLFHYRTKDQAEVDVVAEADDGRMAAIEVKASRTVGQDAFRVLHTLRSQVDRAGGQFVRGVVLYLGNDALSFGDRLTALPVSHLWLPPSS